ncbi:MAG: type II methionyl aminopeptidase [Methanobacteriaceae archaeon]
MIEKYRKAGKITSEVRKMALDKINPNMKVIDLIEQIENEIKKLGGIPAFPCNVSINEVTAHYTSPPHDESILKFGDLVKIDLGAHVDGYIADTAISTLVGGEDYLDSTDIDEEKISKNLDMIETSILAVESAISTIRDGVEVGKVGEVIEDTITSRGFKPVSNLTGHSMDQYILHSGLSIPNIKEKNHHKLEEGDVLAIEPFVTDGVGRVTDMGDAYIFRFLRDRPLRMIQAKKLLSQIKNEYRNLPFAQRWLLDHFEKHRLNASLRQLIQSRAVYPYHVLKEQSNAWVAQAEHTVIVEKDGCEVITK